MRREFPLIPVLAGIAIVTIILAMGGYMLSGPIMGTHGFGPTNTVTVTVVKTYVDTSTGENGDSHYMVATNKGVFECNNGWWLGVWNCDEIFGQLAQGKTYTIKTKGNKVVNFFMQEYPYILSVQEIKQTTSTTVEAK
jgi:hypothetical protein